LGSALSGNSVSTGYFEREALKAAEPESLYLSKPEIEKKIREYRKQMEKAAKDLDFIQAAKLRDEIKALQDKL
jgi:excinuclease ABC subunit B